MRLSITITTGRILFQTVLHLAKDCRSESTPTARSRRHSGLGCHPDCHAESVRRTEDDGDVFTRPGPKGKDDWETAFRSLRRNPRSATTFWRERPATRPWRWVSTSAAPPKTSDPALPAIDSLAQTYRVFNCGRADLRRPMSDRSVNKDAAFMGCQPREGFADVGRLS